MSKAFQPKQQVLRQTCGPVDLTKMFRPKKGDFADQGDYRCVGSNHNQIIIKVTNTPQATQQL